MATTHNLEVLHTELAAMLRMGPVDVQDADTIRAWISQTNRLFDACLACGMPYDTVDHAEWAAERCAADLVEA